MFCNNCHKNLEEFGALLDKMEKCPSCGAVLIKEPKEVPQESFEKLCSHLVESGGKNIFESDISLIQRLDSVDPTFVTARDKMSLLTIKQIPSRLYAAKDFPEEEIAHIINQCQKQLVIDLGVSFDTCKEMLLALQKVIFNKEIPVPAYYVGDSFVDPRDGNIYKTVKIGEQIWMAENLKYECKGCSIYRDDYSNWAKYGYLYNAESLKNVAPNGWRLPTLGDFEKLFSLVGKTSKVKDWHKSLIAKDAAWGKNNIGSDEFGFSVLPGGENYYGCSGLGTSASFWCDDGYCKMNVRDYKLSEGSSSNASMSIRLIKDDASSKNRQKVQK